MNKNSTNNVEQIIELTESIDFKKIYQELSKPIEEEYLTEYIEDGKTFKGYNAQLAINRLNKIVGIENWGVESKIRKEELINGSWVVAMVLVIKIFIDNKLITASGSGGCYSTKIANAYKGARTSAFKNACKYLGIGKELYIQTPDEELIYEKIENEIPEEAVDLEKKINECQNLEQLQSLEDKVKNSEISIKKILYKKYNEKKIALFK